jgi:hypothetical protein
MVEVENELAVVENTTAVSHISQLDLVDIEYAAECQKNFEDLVEALLDKDTDYQGGKKKKSAWRKLAKAFNISDEKVCDRIIRDENYQIISAYFEVKAILPNGRYGIGVGDCSIFDKINKDDAEMPSNFELRKRFTNAEHDVISTAHTRAKSRAISDLIGAGEVSAEEMDEPKKVQRTSRNNREEAEEKVSSSSSEGKPKTRRRRRKPKEEGEVETNVIDTVAEVVKNEDEEVSDDSPKNLKELAAENATIKKAIQRLQDESVIVTKAAVVDEIFKMFDFGKITLEEYDEANNLILN